jgi:hypothetical protein
MKRFMKILSVVAVVATAMLLMDCNDEAIVTFPANLSGQVRNTDYAAWESFTFAMSAANHSAISLDAINGSIIVSEPSTADSIRITGEKRVESESAEDARAQLKLLSVDVQDLANAVLVRTVQPEFSGGRHYIVHYIITLPKNMNVTVNSLNGKVTLDEILGSVSVKVVNGEIDGNVTLPVDATIDMRMGNGTLGLRIPMSTSAKVSSTVSTGNISFSNLDLQNRIETPKSLHGTLGDGRGTVSLNATNGNIRVTGF